MVNIYKALKAAEEERSDDDGVPRKMPGRDRAARALQEKLVGVYQAIDLEYKDGSAPVISFVGARAGEGTSVMVRQFALLLTEHFGKRVLLLDGDTGFGGN